MVVELVDKECSPHPKNPRFDPQKLFGKISTSYLDRQGKPPRLKIVRAPLNKNP